MSEGITHHSLTFHQKIFDVGEAAAALLVQYWELESAGYRDDKSEFHWLIVDTKQWAKDIGYNASKLSTELENLNLAGLIEFNMDSDIPIVRATQKYRALITAYNKSIEEHDRPPEKPRPKKVNLDKCVAVAGDLLAGRLLFMFQRLYLTDEIGFDKYGTRCVWLTHAEIAKWLSESGKPVTERAVKAALVRLCKRGLIAKKRFQKAGGGNPMAYRLTAKCIDGLGVDVSRCLDTRETVHGWKYCGDAPTEKKTMKDLVKKMNEDLDTEPDNDNAAYDLPEAA